mgnify:FL=1
MLVRKALKFARVTQPVRFLSDKKPPKGFEKFYRKNSDNKEKTEDNSDKNKSGGGPNFNNFNNDPKFWAKVAAVAAGGALGAYSLIPQEPPVPDITFQEFYNNYLEPQKAKMLSVEVSQTPGSLTDVYVKGEGNRVIGRIKVPDVNSFLDSVQRHQEDLNRDRKDFINLEYIESKKKGEDYISIASKIISPLVQIAFIGGISYFMFKSLRGGGPKSQGGGGGGFGDIFNMSKANFKVYGVDNKKVGVTFKDVAGLKEAKIEITEFVEFLKNPEKFKKLGARIPRGALLVGPPGTGKTLMAKAAAGEAGVPFFSISGSDFVEMFVGVGASRVRQLFKQAKERSPSIIFIDEIDAVGRKRHGRVGGNDERDNTLNQLLVEMDGFTTDTHVVVMAGTNRKDILDSALLRPGRFDRTIELSLPDLEGRAEILKVHLGPIKLNQEMAIEDYAKRLAALTPGFSGADLSNLCNEAAIYAARKEKDYVDRHDFEAASERVIGGLERSKKLNEKEKNIVAHHEAGHAVAGWFLEGADPVLKVSILPRSKGALGFAQFLPSETMLYSKNELLDKICAVLAGRVSEELFFGRVTTGAQDDLYKATNIAQSLIARFGMSEKLGVVGYNMDEEAFSKPFSEDTNRIIDEEVRAIVGQCLEMTRTLLSEKKELVGALAERLKEKERVTHKELVEILGQRPFEQDEEYNKYVNEEEQEEKEQEAEAEAIKT